VQDQRPRHQVAGERLHPHLGAQVEARAGGLPRLQRRGVVVGEVVDGDEDLLEGVLDDRRQRAVPAVLLAAEGESPALQPPGRTQRGVRTALTHPGRVEICPVGGVERHDVQDSLAVVTHYNVLVLGAGPGGYVAAIRAAQLGQSVAVIEEKYWGGVCLNVGCIPSKALLKNAELAHVLTHEKAKFGIEGDATMSYGPTHKRSRQVSAGIVKGVHFLMKKNKITEIDGWGTLTGARDGKQGVDVKASDGQVTAYTCDNLIIASGAQVRMLPGMQKSENVVTYEEQILDESLPGSIIIGGSGAIGVEFAYVLTNFGVDVTIVEFADRMVPAEDADISKELAKHYKKLGVKVLTSTAVKKVEDAGGGVKVTVAPASGEGEEQVLEADKFLAAFGFAPRVEGYGLESTGVKVSERGAIEIDDYGRTNV